mmetsp:Transcript_28338/g.72243  ORF Transcript_28338/g.72243 Transcript_28338/m.72243 type:complete len:360 (-) Transcript_28338:319-1398(-)|eukprot:CAMPEP_0113889402 /NCGR_PEP_ID=MMETSP0780_2-20120614/13465_1 /TAXON_ID=652834 /ORGANISM="Palpitomonas bilix" /LENGTH=359 /DNA_ID=CAMNT_0000878473 /DNA_START=79 /DNA_END=1158 /DNA_ORIENTATION=- /assembly_acc=CAM_ASM_000599
MTVKVMAYNEHETRSTASSKEEKGGDSEKSEPSTTLLPKSPDQGSETDDTSGKGKKKRCNLTWKSWLKIAILIAVVATIVVTFIVFWQPEEGVGIKEGIEIFLNWSRIEDNRNYGIGVFAAVYIPATVLFVPGLLLTLGAGFAIGFWRGIIAISIGSTIGAFLAFILGRTLMRSWVEKLAQKYKKFGVIDDMVGEQGFKIVLLIRLVPLIPFNALNYILALTRVKAWHYLLASWIGMLPGTAMYVYFGTLILSVTEVISGNYEKNDALYYSLLAVGLVALIILVVVVTIYAKRAFKKAEIRLGQKNGSSQNKEASEQNERSEIPVAFAVREEEEKAGESKEAGAASKTDNTSVRQRSKK